MDQPSVDAVWVVGVDIGGTGTRVALADATGKVLRIQEAGPGNPVRVGPAKALEHLRAGLKKVFLDLPSPWRVGAAAVGMAGRSHPSAEGVVRAAFSEFAMPERRLLSDDGQIALDAAFGDAPGILVMAGTGSGACAQGPLGSFRVGGFGPVIGDEGSAHAIGVAAVRAITRAEDGRGPKTLLAERILATLQHPAPRMLPFLVAQDRIDFASLFPLVDGVAREGDDVAQALLRAAGADLAELARAAGRRSGVPAGSPVATAGSILGHSLAVRDALLEDLARGPGAHRPGPHVENPVEGAVRRAVRALAVPAGAFEQQW